jgi:CRISPR-associated protein Cas2
MIRVVCYDVQDDKRRNRLFKLLKNYGQWIQYSVFEVDCKEPDWILLYHHITQLLKDDDSICIYQMCAKCSKKVQYDRNLTAKLEEEKNNIL